MEANMNTTTTIRFRTTSQGEDTGEWETLGQAIAACEPGETVTVVAYRDGKGYPFFVAAQTVRV